MAVPEAELEQTEIGLVTSGEGWFVLNARESMWLHAEGRSARCHFEGRTFFDQVGINIGVHQPGEAMAMYHWEADQEDFLVISGEGVLIVEGEERPLKQWDFVHCPPGTKHVLVGAGKVGPVRRRRDRRPREVGRHPRVGRLHAGPDGREVRGERRAGRTSRTRPTRIWTTRSRRATARAGCPIKG